VVEALHRSGLIHTDALLSELPRLDLSPYRLVIFATTPVLDEAQRRHVHTQVARAGRHLVFLGYAGWSDGRQLGPELATPLTGLPTRLESKSDGAATFDLDGVVERIDLGRSFAVPVYDAPDGQVMGRWADGTIAAARQEDPETTRWTLALPPQTPAAWRAIGRRAGCRVLNEHDDTTLLGHGLLVVHTLPGGERTLRLPGGTSIALTLPPRSTTTLDAETGQLLLGAKYPPATAPL